MTDEIILQVRGLKKYYGRGENQVRALDGIDLDIEPGPVYRYRGNLRLRKNHAAEHAWRAGPAKRGQRPGGGNGSWGA